MEVRRLDREDEPAIARLLARDPVVNLFLTGFLAIHPVDRAWWYGIGDPIRAVVLVIPARLAVPYGDDFDDGGHLGAHLRDQHPPSLLVGPRAVSDGLWRAWSTFEPRRRHDQRLYRLESAPPGEDPAGFRVGTLADASQVSANAAAMELEDLGVDPRREGRVDHENAVAERLRSGRTWLIEERGRVVFQVNLGTSHREGCQLGGTWVRPDRRGRGVARVGVAAACRRLLAHHPRVTLHVNEANLPAVRVYERVGFVRDAAYRLVVP